ncbi:efflux RND transporter periplasmic adaptor subunit [Flavisolibacter ginsenosidimutans]|uniref:Efflux RND transporter periplasmic adaptor subunit n=1 Tax=Flavisolibacter ginsenosidimutans TaxID=661481 RepID=A0A5B8UKZ4_9BACT|nr:efflux RND transporter periplasmic adaptor subunit [Flavisolibacter ginsenosidimutans]QEC57233.1 efflux RND transporter periplasmic adaptor subunit [Flavisolibacter ginsenosidimutans]
MKNYLIGFVLLSLVAASCGSSKKDEAGNLNDKKAKLQELKTQQDKLTTEITALEKDIAKVDTSVASAKPKLVAVSTVGTDTFSHFIDLQGKLDAQNISYVAPPNGQGGIVKALYVTQGQTVHKGQVLARLDDQTIRQQIEPLRVQLTSAEDTYKRLKSLYDQGIGTYQNVLNAQTQVNTLRQQIGVIQKQASLMTVTAPASGVADIVAVRVGEMFVGATAAGPQIRIVNTSDLKVVAQVPENYVGRVKVGSNILVYLPDLNRNLTAKVTVAGRTIDPTNRAFYIEAKIPSSPELRPNQIAVVKIKDYASNSAITIPVNVLQNDEKGKFVMVAAKEGAKTVAQKRTITVGELYGDKLEVKSGLHAGDVLITEGYQGLYEGQAVTTDAKI